MKWRFNLSKLSPKQKEKLALACAEVFSGSFCLALFIRESLLLFVKGNVNVLSFFGVGVSAIIFFDGARYIAKLDRIVMGEKEQC